jgi:hypothetical protein
MRHGPKVRARSRVRAPMLRLSFDFFFLVANEWWVRQLHQRHTAGGQKAGIRAMAAKRPCAT